MDITSVFTGSPGRRRVGIEVELAPLDPSTGEAVAYHGPCGLAAFLAQCVAEFDGKPLVEREALVGLVIPGGAKISLENGGAVEFSSTPAPRLRDVVAETVDALRRLAGLGAELGIALVPGANFPFSKINNVHWVPNARGEIMRAHFARQGAASSFGRHVMALTTSTQATLDYESPADLLDKLRTASAAATIATALFVNSPIAGGRPTGYLSERMRYWTAIDPIRTGPIPAALREHGDVGDLVAWALDLPMLFRKLPDGTAEPMHRPFAQILRHGFADGTFPTEVDWLAHLSQIWTDVRVRRTIELRSVDGPPWDAVVSVPAFGMGLLYSAGARRATRDLIGPSTVAEHRAAWRDIAQRGLAARWCGQPILPLATELLRIAEAGLHEVEPDVSELLDPLREIVHTGWTFAQRTLAWWDGDPGRYVAAARLPS